jgi:Fur family iron response transcriptional regulator
MYPGNSDKSFACIGSVRAKLVAVGLRPTRQRLDLGQLIFQSGGRHFTAETIFAEARAIKYAPSLATIYNTLDQFAKSGLLREIAVYDSKVWYDTTIGPHFHFYNEDTKELSDIPVEQWPQMNIQPPEGTRIDAVDIIVRLKSA